MNLNSHHTKIRDSIEKFGLRPKKKFGQNFILDFNVLKKIVKVGYPMKDISVIEIGPGPGGLTKAIISQKPKRITLIEKDKQFRPVLQELFKCYPDQDFVLIIDDFLNTRLDDLFKEPTKIFSNLPYYLSTEILFSLLPLNKFICEVVFTFQKEVADRLIAKPNSKSYSRASVMVQYSCKISKKFNLSSRVFYPVPKVDSSVIKLTPKKGINIQVFNQLQFITKLAFGKRRKILKNSLGKIKDISYHLKKERINENIRAEQVTVDQYKRLSESLLSL